MSDILSDKLLGQRFHRAKSRREMPTRAGATLRNFWAARPQKSGVAPAQHGVLPAPKLGVAQCASGSR